MNKNVCSQVLCWQAQNHLCIMLDRLIQLDYLIEVGEREDTDTLSYEFPSPKPQFLPNIMSVISILSVSTLTSQ